MVTTNGSANGIDKEASSLYTIPLQIGGKDVYTSTLFDVTNPSRGKTIWRSCSASKSDAQAAVEAAQAAFESWSQTNPAFRRDILLRAASVFEQRADECRQYMTEEISSQRAFFDHLNLPLTAEMMRDCAGRIASVTNGLVPRCAQEGTSAIVYKEPYGVVLGIAPWYVPSSA
jgi:acyl-CoA reductase-like NAD-dependent aldehyde dehydrogenase